MYKLSSHILLYPRLKHLNYSYLPHSSPVCERHLHAGIGQSGQACITDISSCPIQVIFTNQAPRKKFSGLHFSFCYCLNRMASYRLTFYCWVLYAGILFLCGVHNILLVVLLWQLVMVSEDIIYIPADLPLENDGVTILVAINQAFR